MSLVDQVRDKLASYGLLQADAPLVRFVRWAHLDNPLNMFLVAAILWTLYGFVPKQDELSDKVPNNPAAGYNWRPDAKGNAGTIVWRTWTPKQLRPYDGTNDELEGGRILFAIRRKVYDVTLGKNFYGPGGPYAIFAGRDATRGMAKQSFESDMLTPVDEPIDTLTDLTPSEWSNLLDWESHFETKYTMCGDLVEN